MLDSFINEVKNMPSEDYIFLALTVFAILVAGWILLSILYGLYRLIFLKFYFDEVKEMSGIITDMEYEASRFNGKRSSPEKNYVRIKTGLKETQLDSDELYQRVRVGESVTVRYQDYYTKPRFWEGPLELDGHRLISVTSVLNQTVEFNTPKKVSNIERVRRGF